MAKTDQAPTLKTQTPSVGRIVHYSSYGTPGGEYEPACRAAVITHVHPDLDPAEQYGPYVALAVLNPTGLFFNAHVPYDPTEHPGGLTGDGGTWHWPEIV